MKDFFARIRSILKVYGLSGLGRGFLERRASWSLSEAQIKRVAGFSSSASDNSSYLGICFLAAEDDQVFNIFRRNRNFRQILEHVSKNQGKKYLREIHLSNISANFGEFLRRQSEIGSPFTYKYPGFGAISPTGLRYLKVYSDLNKLFGKLDAFNIGEIGIGFGGQASLIVNSSQVAEYHLFDLPEVLKLNEKFLGKLESTEKYVFHDGRNPVEVQLDLIISNYAFSELIRSVQEMYLRNVILNSLRGYITWNDIAYKDYGSYSLEELLEIIPGSEIMPETPLTAAGNVIIVWGHKTIQ